VLAPALPDADAGIRKAAALALGEIGTKEAAKLLSAEVVLNSAAGADASIACAEKLVAAGEREAGKTIYQKILMGNPPPQIQLAASRGLHQCSVQ